MVQRTSVRGINRYGRASQGVRLMNLREDDVVSAIALVVESDAETDAPVVNGGNGATPAEIEADAAALPEPAGGDGTLDGDNGAGSAPDEE